MFVFQVDCLTLHEMKIFSTRRNFVGSFFFFLHFKINAQHQQSHSKSTSVFLWSAKEWNRKQPKIFNICDESLSGRKWTENGRKVPKAIKFHWPWFRLQSNLARLFSVHLLHMPKQNTRCVLSASENVFIFLGTCFVSSHDLD